VLSTTGIIPFKVNENLKILNLGPTLHTAMQKAIILNTWFIVRKFLAEL
jgi:hypothetical protein